MHSTIGPASESELIFLAPSRIRERLAEPSSSPLVLWDVGMGIAGNSAPVWDFIHGAQVRRPVEIHSFEKHPEGLAQALEETSSFPFLDRHERDLLTLLASGRCQTVQNDIEHRWVLHSGDFESLLQGSSMTCPAADLIFWDFYSPKICPELWSLELFQIVREKAPRSLLWTYSAATPVRAALLLAGFQVGLPFVGDRATPIKAESTVAAADPIDTGAIPRLLDQSWLEKLSRSTQFRPYGNSHWSLAATYDEIAAEIATRPQFRHP
jgi:tRNA U34 5-methylaminomethyl-2-thiouridine-forming methyltransferase MnmC